MRVVCAMSGGVDSALAAALLVDEGHEVIGLTMRLYDADPSEAKGRGGTCCSPAEVDLARQCADRLGIAHYSVDERERFAAQVIDPFVRDYAAGRTPNPCTRCNQHIKFGPLLGRARALGAEVLATGHYARIESAPDGLALRRGVDPRKDQSYFLFAMGGDTLPQVRFPLGGWTKDEVRAEARRRGMPNADAPDSQELCFVPGGDHADVVEARAEALGLTDTLGAGPVVDEQGQTLGEHRGIHRVTVGQRRGLSLPGTERRFVLRVLPQSRTVVVGPKASATATQIVVEELTRLGLAAQGSRRAMVQVRHRSAPQPATVEVAGTRATVRFDAPIPAAAPGQAAVIYGGMRADEAEGDRVLGGGWIARVD